MREKFLSHTNLYSRIVAFVLCFAGVAMLTLAAREPGPVTESASLSSAPSGWSIVSSPNTSNAQLNLLSGVTCTVGGLVASVQYAGPQGTLAGLDQVNIGLPLGLMGKGLVDIVLSVDGHAANTVQVDIK